MRTKILESIANTLLLLLLLMAAVSYKGKLFGHKPEDLFKSSKNKIEILPPTSSQLNQLELSNVVVEEQALGIWTTGNEVSKEYIINSKAFSKGIYGFAGQVPLYLYLDKSKRIKRVLLMENSETPEFMKSIQEEGIISQWFGKTSTEISDMKPDVVSGATLTSNAINRTIQASLAATGNGQRSTKWYAFVNVKTVAALLVIISGLLISFKTRKNKHLRTLQLILNTAILGLWCGKFISFNILLGWISNGMNLLTSSVVFVMLVLSITMPLFFKKKSYYCNWVCPFGSAQELAGRLNKKKIHPGKKLMAVLKHSQMVITLGLFFSMWMGVASDIADYEPFSAFLFKHASPVVLSIAGLSLILAIFTPRPWCRFVCPTGQILNWTYKM